MNAKHLVLAFAVATSIWSVADACGDRRDAVIDRANGTVVVFRDIERTAIQLGEGAAHVTVQYPKFANGTILYMDTFTVALDGKLWKLDEAINRRLAVGTSAHVGVSLEKHRDGLWHIVSLE